MSDERRPVQLPKWPFYLADIVLSAVAVFILWRLGPITGPWELAATIGCLVAAALGAWMSITPWLSEFRQKSALAESTQLESAIEKIQELESVGNLIRSASSQWQGVQDAASRTVQSAQEIASRMKAESEEFMKFLDHAQGQERAGLRLEVEKLRRMEGDWLKMAVQMLDHTFALTQAALRSGQQGLISQLQQFQNACRDVARRMGLAPFAPQSGEPFEAQAHQLTDPKETPPEGARVADVLATGYTYQGQLLRRALVTVTGERFGAPESAVEPLAEPLPDAGVEQESEPSSEIASEPAAEAQEQSPEPEPRDESPQPHQRAPEERDQSEGDHPQLRLI